MFKNMKWNSLLMAIGYIAGGVFLITFPNTLDSVMCNIIGAVIILVGIIHIINYVIMDIRKALYRGDFVEGVIMIFIGILIIYEKETFSNVIPSILSLFIIIGGFSLLQDAIDATRLGFKGSWLYVVLGLIPIVYGILILFGVVATLGYPLYLTIGAGLIYCGAASFFSSIHLSGRIAKYIRELEETEKAKEEKIKHDVLEETVFVPGTDGPVVVENQHTSSTPTVEVPTEEPTENTEGE